MNRRSYARSFLLLLPALLLADSLRLDAETGLVDRFEVDQVIHDIAFRNGMEGYAITDEQIFVTTDGGTTWTRTMPIVFRPPFRSIALFGESGIILGDMFGGVHITTDAESDWRSTQLVEGDVTIENPPVTEIEVVDGAHWVAIAGSFIYVTRDSGVTFTAVSAPNGRPITALDVTSADLMHISENVGSILRSTDGGETWNPMGGFGEIYDVHFLSADTGFVASWYPWNLFTTVDGGATWTAGPFEYPTSIAVAPSGSGAYTTPGYMRLSHDHGMTWTDSIPLRDAESDPFNEYHDQKVVSAGEDRLFLLMSNSETNRSVIARIDVASGVIEERYALPEKMDISLYRP